MVQKITGFQIQFSRLLWLAIAGVVFTFPAVLSATSAPIKISISIPTQALDFSDIDARDEFNRPIKSHAVAMRFSELVTMTLHATLVKNLTPLNRLVQNVLQRNWDMMSGWWRKIMSIRTEKVRAWIAQTKKIKVIHSASRFKIQSADFVKRTVEQIRFTQISSLLSSTQLLR